MKQQENEREGHAIHALRRAVELDPGCLDAWLALAVSCVNEGDKAGTYEAVRAWVKGRETGRLSTGTEQEKVARVEDAFGEFDELLGRLIGLVRVSEGVDADVQIALGIVLHTNQVRLRPLSRWMHN